jgi:hypothetical protein
MASNGLSARAIVISPVFAMEAEIGSVALQSCRRSAVVDRRNQPCQPAVGCAERYGNDHERLNSRTQRLLVLPQKSSYTTPTTARAFSLFNL